MFVSIVAVRNDCRSVHSSFAGVQNRISVRQYGRVERDRSITLVDSATICMAR